MEQLLASAVGIPVLSIILFSILEAVGGTTSLWENCSKVGLDLCIVSIGIVGGMFANPQLLKRMQQASAVIAITIILVNLILAGVVMAVQKRLSSWSDRRKAYASLFFGVFAVAVPSGMILWVGRQ